MNRQIELREDSGGNGKLTLEGYASRTETPYEVLGFTETIRRGAFKRSLREGPDTSLLVNHEGLPIARTTAGTLALSEDEKGLHVRATLEPEDPDVQAIAWKMRSGALSEMSMGFRATKQAWNEDRTNRIIHEVALHRGDVSIVSAAASPTSTATLRSVEATLEQRQRMVERIGDRLCGPVGFTLSEDRAPKPGMQTCEACDGTGQLEGEPCNDCDGTGEVSSTGGQQQNAATRLRNRDRVMIARSHLELAKARQALGGAGYVKRKRPGTSSTTRARSELDLAKAHRAAMPSHPHVAPRYTYAEIQAAGKAGEAHKRVDGKFNYPIKDGRDLADAILSIGRTDAGERFSVKRWIVYRAKLLGMKSEVPKAWITEVGEAVPA